MADTHSKTDNRNGGRTKSESTLPDGQVAGSDKDKAVKQPLTGGPEPDSEGEPERTESDWGLAPEKPRMKREAILMMVVILLLLGGFGYAVYTKLQKKAGEVDVAGTDANAAASDSGTGNVPPTDGTLVAGNDQNETGFDPANSAAPTQNDSQLEDELLDADEPPPAKVKQAVAREPRSLDIADDPFAGGDTPARNARDQLLEPDQDPERDTSLASADPNFDQNELEDAEEAAEMDDDANLDSAPRTTPLPKSLPQTAELADDTDLTEDGELVSEDKLGGHRLEEDFSAETKSSTQVVSTPETRSDDRLQGYREQELLSGQAGAATNVGRPAAVAMEPETRAELLKELQELDEIDIGAGNAQAPASQVPQSQPPTVRTPLAETPTVQAPTAQVPVPVKLPEQISARNPAIPAAIIADEFDVDLEPQAPPRTPAHVEQVRPATRGIPAVVPRAHSEPHPQNRRHKHKPVEHLNISNTHVNHEHAAHGEIYVVQPHDNYWIISRKKYGTGRYYQALARHNQERVADPLKMRPGMKLVTPSKEVLEQSYPDILKGTASTQVAGYRATDTATAPGYGVSSEGQPLYRVGPEDTLTGISQQHLGRSSRWTEIFELNRAALASPDSLKIGTVLKLPRDASEHRLAKTPREYR